MKHARFYQASRWHCDEGQIVSWHRLKRDALQAIKDDMRSDEFTQPITVTKHEIPLSTDEFIRFLNRHVTRDNG